MARHPADLDLARRMLAGREDAFDDFAERFYRPLYAFAAARLDGDRERTRDTVQTTLAKALGSLTSYRGEAALLTWLCAICRNEVLMGLRRRACAPMEEEVADGVEPAAGAPVTTPRDPQDLLLEAEARARVHAALASLPADYARALSGKYLELLPVRDVATRLGLSEKAAESLLTRARRAFATTFDALARDPGARAARGPS